MRYVNYLREYFSGGNECPAESHRRGGEPGTHSLDVQVSHGVLAEDLQRIRPCCASMAAGIHSHHAEDSRRRRGCSGLLFKTVGSPTVDHHFTHPGACRQDEDEEEVENPLLRSFCYACRYHLGTIALGSLIITLLKIPRHVYSFIYDK